MAAVIYDRNLESTDSIDRLPITLLVVLAIIFGVPNIIDFGIKLLHCVSGLKIFGIGCMLIDVAFIGYFAWGLIKDFPYDAIFKLPAFNEAYMDTFLAALTSVVWMIVPILISFKAFVSNIRSLNN